VVDERVSPHDEQYSAREHKIRSIDYNHWLLEPAEEVGRDRLYCDPEEKQKIQPNKNEVAANKRPKEPVVTIQSTTVTKKLAMGEQLQDIPKGRMCAMV
jgi:hypothetical protein